MSTINTSTGIVYKQGDLAGSVIAPSADQTDAPAESVVVVRSYTISSGTKLTIGLGARLRIL